MIELLLRLIDKLIQLEDYENEKLNRVFATLVEPLYNDLAEVHRNYLEMFSGAEKILRDGNDTLRGVDALALAIQNLAWQRLELATVRLKIHAIAEEVNRTNSPVDHQSLFWGSVEHYLFGPLGPLSRDGTATTTALTWLRRWARESEETREPTDLTGIADALAGAAHKLDESFGKVSQNFAKLKVDAAQR